MRVIGHDHYAVEATGPFVLVKAAVHDDVPRGRVERFAMRRGERDKVASTRVLEMRQVASGAEGQGHAE